MKSKKLLSAAAAAAAVTIAGTLLAVSPANAMPPLTQDRDYDGVVDYLDPDADSDKILNYDECNGADALANMLADSPDAMFKPSMFGLGLGLTKQNVSADISAHFGYPASSGAVIATIENAHTHPTADAFISGWNDVTGGPSGETRVQFTGTLGVYVSISPDEQWFSEVNDDRKTLFTHDGTLLTDINTDLGFPGGSQDPAHPSSLWTRSSAQTADGYRYDIQGPHVAPLGTWWNYRATYISGVVPDDNGTSGLGIVSPTFDWGFDSQIHGPAMYPTMFFSLFAECDTDGDGIGDRLDRDILGEDDEESTPMDTPVTVDVLSNDPTQQTIGDLQVKSITQPSHGTAVLNADGTTTYTPNAGWTGVDTYTYTAIDPVRQTITQTVTITVLPVGADDQDTTPTDTAVTVDVIANDPTQTLRVQALTPPANGTVALNEDGTVTYTPASGFSGTDTFTYTATDPSGQPVTQTVTILVTPTGADDSSTTAPSTPVVIDVLSNDPTRGLTVTEVAQPANGKAVIHPDGTITYTPAEGFFGTDIFTYTAVDAEGQLVTQTVSVTVPTAPVEPETPVDTPAPMSPESPAGPESPQEQKTGEVLRTDGVLAPVIGLTALTGVALGAGLWLMARRRRTEHRAD